MKAEFIRLGNTVFNKTVIKSLSYSKFKEAYIGKLKGIDIREAFIACGGKIVEPKVKEEIKEEKKEKKKKNDN